MIVITVTATIKVTIEIICQKKNNNKKNDK